MIIWAQAWLPIKLHHRSVHQRNERGAYFIKFPPMSTGSYKYSTDNAGSPADRHLDMSAKPTSSRPLRRTSIAIVEGASDSTVLVKDAGQNPL